MSVYIKGMEMPTEGFITVTITSDGRVVGNSQKINGKFEYLDNKDIASAIPVPDHGRLIDADALKNTVYAALEDAIRDDNATSYGAALCAFIAKHIVGEIEAAPTIIPAEEGQ